MKGMDKKIFPEDSDWLRGSFGDLREMFGSFEYLAKYIKRRFPNAKDTEIESVRSLFLIEAVEVEWLPPEKLKRRRVNVGYGVGAIVVFEPEMPKYTEEDKRRIEDEHYCRWAPRIKESHSRVNTLLWYLLGEEKKAEIRKFFPDEIPAKDLNLKD